MSRFNLYWEGRTLCQIDVEEHGGLTPLDLLEQAGEEGREGILEILFLNYREETKAFIAGVERFEKNFFGGPK